MASKQKSKSKKFGSTKSKAANSLSYSTTSSSKQYLDTSIDGQSSPASSSVRSKPHFYSQTLPLGAERSKENVTVTVRFRPLSPREIRQGEEIAWYADGETIVRNEHNPSIAYAYDRVFGPTTTTRNVYDVAAQHVVSGAMEGISGTIFAYGVTSSGKTHTMHGDQRSPGIIPLAVKDAFSIIQETPNREFLLRVSYLEIYNEVMNDLLNPAGQNLRIREDSQGIFVEGIKEEVVLSPAHALSLIAAGEEHRHVGSTNFNLLSSRSHTIFTLTIESSPCGENSQGEAVSLSQLNLIDLAGSESSKAETTGVRRKEGSYINKSLLTLGTVISKLTDGRAAHIPYRDSKLTRLLQSSLSGHGRVSLICTVTPSSSSSEETHNTLKFAHRAKHIEIQAAQNKIIDEKSLIKKYQNEIRSLKEELEQLRRGIVRVPQLKATAEEDLVLLKQKLACLPHKRQDLILDNGNIELHEGNAETTNATLKEKKTRKHGLLNWLMPRKRESGLGTLTSTSDKSSEIKSMSTPSTPQGESSNLHTEARLSHSLLTESSPSAELLSEAREDREVHGDNFRGHETPLASIKSIDQIELLREQKKILSGEVALHSSALKRLSEVAKRNPQKDLIHVEMKNLKDEIMGKNEQIALLEKQITDSIVVASHKKIDNFELSHSVSELMAQLNEKSFELEVKAADNRVIQEQLNQKISECGGLQDTIASLKQQLSDALESSNLNTAITYSQRFTETESSHGEDGSGKGLLLGAQATAIEELKQKVGELTESKEQLELRNQKLAEESSYAKGLASAAAVELKALSEEVAKLMNHNERLAAELAASKNSPSQRRTSPAVRNGRRDSHVKRNDQGGPVSDIKRELAASRERELSYEAALLEKDQREAQLQRTVEESKQREAYLENELANMWVLVAKLKNSHGAETEASESTRQTPRVEGFGI
ncbi:kinesin-like protein KIN-7K, chloroplastic isoform X3 [Juglans microcarpa x Juglans regia]|uniref:kinesin-like protein KIN-7K, chloroplastic isoform X3 n=1 Tax=Juglans microcarpa x Juglans regia TaxID=2249226 RepID=UPI001B7F4F5A|nr:kinesin-like protein KIN-7K, chloroplastic isoform X3 [Juglans microcarpa x Juglans regia]